jgi:hypothetical protein
MQACVTSSALASPLLISSAISPIPSPEISSFAMKLFPGVRWRRQCQRPALPVSLAIIAVVAFLGWLLNDETTLAG